jgi:glycosyltransferase
MLVIDGASSDATLKIVESFGSEVIRVFSEQDRGVYDAMNKGFHLFQGDAVGFLNSDEHFTIPARSETSPQQCKTPTSFTAISI